MLAQWKQKDEILRWIKREIEAERAEAVRLSSEGAKPVYFVYNNSVSETANEILAITRNYLLNREREATDEAVIHHI